MSKCPKTPKGWYSADVSWRIPGRKKPIAYSTRAASDAICVLAEDGSTIQELFNKFLPGTEESKVLEQYIKYGYGDVIAKTWFN